jgi:predicted PilT family ATPase
VGGNLVMSKQLQHGCILRSVNIFRMNRMIKTTGEPRDLMQTQDVSRKTHRYIDRTQRHGDLLDPNYTIHGAFPNEIEKNCA